MFGLFQFQINNQSMIDSVCLPQQSLDDVGEELNHMRTELHKLMEVIQVKDQEIEGLEGQLQEVKRLATER